MQYLVFHLWYNVQERERERATKCAVIKNAQRRITFRLHALLIIPEQKKNSGQE